MSPFDVFDPSAALDPTRYAGQAGAARLLQAAEHFPGGPVALVLALFFAPVGPGVPAGVLLARHVPLTRAATFGLYALSLRCKQRRPPPGTASAQFGHSRGSSRLLRPGRRQCPTACGGVA